MSSGKGQPNILLICTDQQRSDSLACCGHPLVNTPNLDRLAERGCRFTRHMAANQICQPSRASLFTGLHQRHHRVLTNGMCLDESLATLPGCLAEAGYRTHGVGKFHFQPLAAPASRGFPESNAFWTTPASRDWDGPFYGMERIDLVIGEADWSTDGGHYARWLEREHPDSVALMRPEAGLDRVPADLPETWKSAIPPDLHYNSWIADRAVAFLEAAEDPFFLFVSFPDPHHPFAPPRPYCDRYDPADVPMPRNDAGELDAMPGYIQEIADVQDQWTAKEQGSVLLTRNISEASLRRAIAHTCGMIDMIDESVGRIFRALEAKGRFEDTIILFTSDHGEFLGDHGLLRKGPPPYRQLLEVTHLLSGPGVPGGRRIDALTSHLDIMPTLLQFAGVVEPETDGTSLLPLLSGGSSAIHPHLFAEYHPRSLPEVYNQTVVTPDWRLTLYPERADWGELFDLAADPGEHRNLFGDPARAGVAKALASLLAEVFPPKPEFEAEVIARW